MRLFTTRRPAPLPCREVVELVTAYLEDALAPAERARLEAHLDDCPHCSEYLAQLRTTLRVVGAIAPADLTPAAEESLGAAFAAWAAEPRTP